MNLCTRSTRLLVAAVLATAASAAFAADTAEQRVFITASPAAVQAAQQAQAAQAAQAVLVLRDLDTAYEMSTGRRMVVSAFGDAVRMRYGRRAAAVLRHDGAGSFVSPDGRLSLQFELDPAGEPQLVRLTLPSAWQ